MTELTSQQLLSIGNNLKTLNQLSESGFRDPAMLDLPDSIDYIDPSNGLAIGFAVFDGDAE